MKTKELTTEGTESRGILLCNPAFPRFVRIFRGFSWFSTRLNSYKKMKKGESLRF
jgi:hypothetical protein